VLQRRPNTFAQTILSLSFFACDKAADHTFLFAREIGIGAAVTRRPLPHHRAYGSVHGGSSWLR
jgi:hypothetical protein